MACTVRISSCILSHKLALKHKYLSHLICNRYFCSKENDEKVGSSSIDDPTSEKLKEDGEEASRKPKKSRFKVKPITEETKEAAKQKLMSLLSEITVVSDSPGVKLNIAKAMKRISKQERLARIKEETVTPEKEMKMAVKAVASSFKEDSEKIESELSQKVSSLNLIKETTPEEVEVKDIKDAPLIDDKLSANLMSSVEAVADTISESPIPPRSELTKRLMRLSLDQKPVSEAKSVRSVIEGMVIKSQKDVQPSPEVPPEEKTQVVKRKLPQKKVPAHRIEKINLFGSKPLNIFDPSTKSDPDSTNTFWQKLQEKELILLTEFAPANAFEEMIRWTEQGKHWKFPIDNETEMGAEENVGFHEHVFLENHLKEFPKTGPIRHFMELVCVGLSKNPYITVERKIENIEWFRNYFKEKEEILRDAGAIE